jgi:hypothetical protein
MKKLITVIVLATMFASCEKQASVKPATETATKKGKGHTTAEATTATITLANNGDGTFNVDYGGATNVVWMFFRTGDSLSAGNVYPTNTQSFYLNPVTTFTSNISGTYYQSVVVTGSTERDVNGVIGADWVYNYSNVVQ